MSLGKNKHEFLSSFHKVRQHSELNVHFMLKWDQAQVREGANLPPKGHQTQSEPRGGR